MKTDTQIAIFKGRKIRKTLYNNEWWFSVVDVVGVLTDSENPCDYWYKMKIREKDEAGIQLSTICRQLKLVAPDGKGNRLRQHRRHFPHHSKERRKIWPQFILM